MYLQVSPVIRKLDGARRSRTQNPGDLCAAQKSFAEGAPLLDVSSAATGADGLIDRRRRAGRQDFENDSSRRRSDVRDLRQRSVTLNKRRQRLVEPGNGGRRALVPPLALARRLQRRVVTEQAADDRIDVHRFPIVVR